MKRSTRLVIVLALLAVAIAVAACSSGSSSSGSSSGGTGGSGTGSGASSVTVSLKNFAFDPSTINVAVGGSVTFVNNDSTTHDVVGDSFDSGQLAAGKSFTQSFPTAGTFNIHCSIHPSMTAQVIVK